MTRVCFVTAEFHGLFKNGGIGTANTGLALALAEAGMAVTVAYVHADHGGARSKAGDFSEVQAHYRARGIALEVVPPHPQLAAAFSDPRPASLSVLHYIEHGAFDIVLFNDNGGQGYYALLAKHTGIMADPPVMLVVTHGPFDWVLELNSLEYWSRIPVAAAFMERRCAALADRLISPSRYMIDWMQARGWSLPERARVIQNLVAPVRTGEALPPPQHQPITELVFFGRQEVRKGIELFCDALDLLQAAGRLSGVTVTFLGKFSRVGGLHSGVYVVERSRPWASLLRLATDFDQAQALAYLSRPGVLAVIPSLAENSPCVVLECMLLGLPFLATDSGGTAELIAPPDRGRCLFPPDAAALAARLTDVLHATLPPSRPAVTQAAVRAQWLDLLRQAAAARTAGPAARSAQIAAPTTSVILVQPDPSTDIGSCLESILQQTCAGIDILLVRIGGGDPACPAGAAMPIRVIETHEPGCGRARAAAAAAASGDYLLFVDEACVLLPDCIETLVRAALLTGADLLTGLPWLDPALDPSGQTQELPLGGCVELGGFENCFGSGVILAAARVFGAGAPVFEDDRPAARDRVLGDRALQDWLFLANAALAGRVLEVVPKPLYRRPVSAPGLDAGRIVARQRRIMQAYYRTPASVFSHIVEGLMQIGPQSRRRISGALPQLADAARDTAQQLAQLDPNAPEARRAFINYCGERRLAALAMDFAILNGAVHLAEAGLAAAGAAGAAAMDIIMRRPVATLHELDLSKELRRRVRAMSPPPAGDVKHAPDIVAKHPLGPDTAVLKGARICPPGTARVRARVFWQAPSWQPHMAQAGGAAAQVALAVCGQQARLVLGDALDAPQGVRAWSGWTDAEGGAHVEVAVVLPEPLDDLSDLYLLSRRTGTAHGAEGMLTWERVFADLLTSAVHTPSRVEREVALVPVPAETMLHGTLITDVSDFPLPVYVPGARTLLHPVPGRPVLVRLASALPAGARGVRAVVSVEHEEAHPIDFALWLLAASAEPASEAAVMQAPAFSGWQTVAEPRTRHYLAAYLDGPASTPMDVYIATRVSGFGDVHFCHAYWNEIIIIESA